MKKIYLSALALSIGTLSFGQALQQKMAFGAQNVLELKNEVSNNINNKALGSIIYSNDFEVPADWTINNDGQSGSTYGWTIDATNDGWWSTNGITSTNGGMYAELSNGDPQTTSQATGVTYTMTTATSIDLIALGGAGSENCVLEFEQYGARFNDLQEIQISTNGTIWTPVGDNLGFQILSQTNPGVQYPNPDLKLIDLSPYLNATTAQTVWIRFSWTTDFPTLPVSDPNYDNVWIAYGWYIDDLKIRTKPDNDLIVTNSEWASQGIHYHSIPSTQVAPIDYSANVINSGGNNLGNAILSVDVNTGASVVTSTPVTINSNATDSLVATYTPAAAVGTHTFTWEISSDSIDDTPTDNVIPGNTFDVVSAVGLYSRDTDGTPGNNGGYNTQVSPATQDFEAGSYFDIYATQQVGRIDVVIGTNAQVGSIFDVVLYEDGATFTQIERSAAHIVAAGEPGTVISLALPSQPTLTAGTTYFAAVHGWGSTGFEFFYGTSGLSPDNDGSVGATSLIFYPSMTAPNANENYFTTQTPMVRLNFDLTVGVDDINSNLVKFNVYPNPSAGIFNINLNSSTSDNVNLTVTSIIGKTIINRSIAVSGNTTETISLTDYSKGIYFLTINGSTTKLIVD